MTLEWWDEGGKAGCLSDWQVSSTGGYWHCKVSNSKKNGPFEAAKWRPEDLFHNEVNLTQLRGCLKTEQQGSNDVILVWVWRPRSQESPRCKFHQKLAGWRPKKSWSFSSSLKAEKDQYPGSCNQSGEGSLFLEGGLAFLFYSGLQMIGWEPFTLGRIICSTQSVYSEVNLIPNALTSRTTCDQMSQYSVAQSCWCKIHYHKY